MSNNQASFVVHLLSLLSALNAFYTFMRKRHYRLFEASIEKAPSTPSAHRVRVDSSPLPSSPLRFFSNIMSIGSADSRAHPSAERDVWELALWDPHPLAIRLFCLFSPGHVLVYWLFLPTKPSDPRPSVTIATTIFLAALLTVQMSTLSSSFSQQAKDAAIVHKEVLNEYDTKFVHPRTQPLMRDVATQYYEAKAYQARSDEKYNTVETYTPTHVLNRGFRTSPNPNYVNYVDPDGQSRCRYPARPSLSSQNSGPSVSIHGTQLHSPSYVPDPSSPIRIPSSAIQQPQFRTPGGTSDGGNLGVYSHANSPLRKSASSHFDQRSSRQAEELDLHDHNRRHAKRTPSPLKRSSVLGGISTAVAAQRWGHLANVGHGIRRESGRF
jgi:hypothetical protein